MCAKIAIFEPGASKILIIFSAELVKIPIILARDSSSKGKVAILLISSLLRISFPIIPPRILRFSLFFENLANIFAEDIASFEKATAVGPENKFVISLHFVWRFVLKFYAGNLSNYLN